MQHLTSWNSNLISQDSKTTKEKDNIMIVLDVRAKTRFINRLSINRNIINCYDKNNMNRIIIQQWLWIKNLNNLCLVYNLGTVILI